MSFKRLLAVDPSLTCSGWALFAVSGESLLSVGKIPSLSTKYPLETRFKDLQKKIRVLFEKLEIDSKDVVVCESQTTMKDPSAAMKVEQVRGMFEVMGRHRNATVPGRINPRSVHLELLGMKGKQLSREIVKGAAVETVLRVYAEALEQIGFSADPDHLKKNQDIVDAILIGSYALARVQGAKAASIPLREVFDREYHRYTSTLSSFLNTR